MRLWRYSGVLHYPAKLPDPRRQWGNAGTGFAGLVQRDSRLFFYSLNCFYKGTTCFRIVIQEEIL